MAFAKSSWRSFSSLSWLTARALVYSISPWFKASIISSGKFNRGRRLLRKLSGVNLPTTSNSRSTIFHWSRITLFVISPFCFLMCATWFRSEITSSLEKLKFTHKRCKIASVSSTGLRSSLCKFSSKATWTAFISLKFRTITGISVNPMTCAAR